MTGGKVDEKRRHCAGGEPTNAFDFGRADASGDTAPIPVTTIRRIFYPVSICALTCLTWQRQLGLANFLVTASARILAKRAASGALMNDITAGDAVDGSPQ